MFVEVNQVEYQIRKVKTMEKNYVVKINTALSNKPFFVKISDPEITIDHIFSEAITSLKNSDRPLEGAQLEQLYEKHQIFNAGKLVEKGDLFKELSLNEQKLGDQDISVVELDLVTSHSGG